MPVSPEGPFCFADVVEAVELDRTDGPWGTPISRDELIGMIVERMLENASMRLRLVCAIAVTAP